MRNPYPTHYRVQATGEVLETITDCGSFEVMKRRFGTDSEWGFEVIRLLDNQTGEIRTFRLDAVEPVGK